jgi:hypothetical protein
MTTDFYSLNLSSCVTFKTFTLEDAGLQARSLTLITNKNLKNAILRRFSDESVFSSNADAVVKKNGAALIFANFFQHCTAAEFV